MKSFAELSGRQRAAFVALVLLAGSALIWGKGIIGHTDVHASKNEAEQVTTAIGTGHAASGGASESTVELSEKQAGTLLKFGPVGTHEFEVLKTVALNTQRPAMGSDTSF